MPELKVIFPQVKDIAVARTLQARSDTTSMDTLNVALVTLSSPLSIAKSRELSRYLSARLNLRNVRVVNLAAR